jgi:N-acetylglucosamine kinase-like BadF-type ATPase
MSTDAGAVVGVDVGGTKTRVRVVDAGGRTLADRTHAGKRPPMLDAAGPGWVADAIRETCAEAGSAVVAVGVGAHGCDTDPQCAWLAGELAALVGVPVAVRNDAEILVLAAGFASGVGVVVGTGSIAVGRRPDGTQLHAGGWGWLLGDEGSAPALVREAARAVLAADDAGEPRDGLAERLEAALGVSGAVELAQELTHHPDVHVWASHAPVVFDAAQAGSATARRVIADAGAALAGLVEQLDRRGATTGTVVTGGGVVVAQPALHEAFAAALRARLPGSELHLLTEAPVVGAVALARSSSVLDAPG